MKKLSSQTKSLITISLAALVLLALPLGLWAINTQEDGYQTTTSFQEIRVHGDCKRVRHTGSKSYFIPTKTRDEADHVLSNPPADLEVQACGGGGGKK